jgi:hypothetical protein
VDSLLLVLLQGRCAVAPQLLGRAVPPHANILPPASHPQNAFFFLSVGNMASKGRMTAKQRLFARKVEIEEELATIAILKVTCSVIMYSSLYLF